MSLGEADGLVILMAAFLMFSWWAYIREKERFTDRDD